MNCSNCQQAVPNNANFCPYCGATLSNTPAQGFRPAGSSGESETTNFKVGRTSEEIKAEYFERSLGTHVRKMINQFMNLAKNKDSEGFWRRKWSFANGIHFKISIHQRGNVKTMLGYIKDNGDGTLSVKEPGLFTSSYHTFSWEEVYKIK